MFSLFVYKSSIRSYLGHSNSKHLILIFQVEMRLNAGATDFDVFVDGKYFDKSILAGGK